MFVFEFSHDPFEFGLNVSLGTERGGENGGGVDTAPPPSSRSRYRSRSRPESESPYVDEAERPSRSEAMEKLVDAEEGGEYLGVVERSGGVGRGGVVSQGEIEPTWVSSVPVPRAAGEEGGA